MDDLLNFLKNNETENRFAFIKNFDFALPNIEIKGNKQKINFPISNEEAKGLVSVSKQAPYGKGHQTLIDTKVRNGWQIDKDEITFCDDLWSKNLNKILRQSEAFFNFENDCFEAEFYKMLIYETGGFFVPHQDTEKIKDMIATLVICLPSEHQGGQLRISHLDDVALFESEKLLKNNEMACIMFYADCWHELTKVTSGNRICLTYNIRVKKKTSQLNIDFRQQNAIDQSISSLRQNFKGSNGLGAIFISLGHQYSVANFCISNLKGEDRNKFEVIKNAAYKVNYNIYLGILGHGENGHASLKNNSLESEQSEYYESIGKNKFGEPYDCYKSYFEDWDGLSLTNYDNNEIDFKNDLDFSIPDSKYNNLILIKNLEDEVVLIGGKFDEADLLNQKDYQNLKFYSGHYTPYTGNEGNWYHLQYQFAVIVLLPPENEFEILLSYNLDAAISKLQREIAKNKSVNLPELKNYLNLFFQVMEDERSSANFYGRRSGSFNSLFDLFYKFEQIDYLQKLILLQGFTWYLEFTPERISIIEKLFTPNAFIKIINEFSPRSGYIDNQKAQFFRAINIIKYCENVNEEVIKLLIEYFKQLKNIWSEEDVINFKEIIISKKGEIYLKDLNV